MNTETRGNSRDAIFANEHWSHIVLVHSKPGNDYVDMSLSGLKKANKNAEGLSRKAGKAEPLRLKQEQEKGVEAERLHKQIVFKDLVPSPIKVKCFS